MSNNQSSLEQQITDFVANNPTIEHIDAFFPDLSGVERGKRYAVSDLKKLLLDSVTFAASCFLLDAQGNTHDTLGRGMSDGDPDVFAKGIPGTLAPIPWSNGRRGQLMMTFEQEPGDPLSFEPRNVLKRQVDRLAELGLRPVVAFELEFYLLDRERLDGNKPQPPKSPLSNLRDSSTQVYGMDRVEAFGEVLDDMVANCKALGVPTGPISAEYAPGQYEINLIHVEDPLEAADHCVLFKRVIRATARQHGLQATFMAKPYPELSGSGMHVHVSLLDQDGNNVFDGGPEKIASDNLLHAMGGIMDLMPDTMAFVAPNPNSYRRFVPNAFVPVSRHWSYENRSTALRIPVSDGKARRFEHRMAGADANPYLLLASLLAGIHNGLTNKIDPGEPFEGNAGETLDPALPLRARRALEKLAQSDKAKAYFGEEYPPLYAAAKEAEYDLFESTISPQEYSWYLLAD
ncbi:glutamine synthetase family protein [Rhodovibrionaceae bacterium A322]